MFSFENGPDIDSLSNVPDFSQIPLTYGIDAMPWETIFEEQRLLSIAM
jgi:hypothetical protein